MTASFHTCGVWQEVLHEISCPVNWKKSVRNDYCHCTLLLRTAHLRAVGNLLRNSQSTFSTHSYYNPTLKIICPQSLQWTSDLAEEMHSSPSFKLLNELPWPSRIIRTMKKIGHGTRTARHYQNRNEWKMQSECVICEY